MSEDKPNDKAVIQIHESLRRVFQAQEEENLPPNLQQLVDELSARARDGDGGNANE